MQHADIGSHACNIVEGAVSWVLHECPANMAGYWCTLANGSSYMRKCFGPQSFYLFRLLQKKSVFALNDRCVGFLVKVGA